MCGGGDNNFTYPNSFTYNSQNFNYPDNNTFYYQYNQQFAYSFFDSSNPNYNSNQYYSESTQNFNHAANTSAFKNVNVNSSVPNMQQHFSNLYAPNVDNTVSTTYTMQQPSQILPSNIMYNSCERNSSQHLFNNYAMGSTNNDTMLSSNMQQSDMNTASNITQNSLQQNSSLNDISNIISNNFPNDFPTTTPSSNVNANNQMNNVNGSEVVNLNDSDSKELLNIPTTTTKIIQSIISQVQPIQAVVIIADDEPVITDQPDANVTEAVQPENAMSIINSDFSDLIALSEVCAAGKIDRLID